MPENEIRFGETTRKAAMKAMRHSCRPSLYMAAALILLVFGEKAIPALVDGGMAVVPSFSSRDESGKSIPLDSLLDGKEFLVITFWSVKCAPCLDKIKLMNELWGDTRFRRKASMIAVNTDRYNAEDLTREMKARGIIVSFPVVPDVEQTLTNRFVNGFIPLTVLIDRNRRHRFSILGSSTNDLRYLERTVIGEGPEVSR